VKVIEAVEVNAHATFPRVTSGQLPFLGSPLHKEETMLNRTATTIVALLCATALYAGTAPLAQAAYPEKPVTVTVPFPAGGGVDMVGRLYAQQIGEATGAQAQPP
jgi:hypothetical protein